MRAPFPLLERLSKALATSIQRAPTATAVYLDGSTVWGASWSPDGLRTISGPYPGPTMGELAAVVPVALADLDDETQALVEVGIELHALAKSERVNGDRLDIGWLTSRELVA